MLSPINKIIAYGAAFNSFRMLIGAISALYLLSKGVSLTELGLLKTFQAGIIFILEIPLSYFADRKSRRISVILSVATGTVWLLLTGLGSEIWHFFLAEAFNAISLALLSGSLISYIVDTGKTFYPEEHSKKWIGRYEKIRFFGMGIASFVGAAFVSVDSSLIWIIAGLLCLTLLVLFSSTLPIEQSKSEVKAVTSFSNTIGITFKTLTRLTMPFSMVLALVMVMMFYQIIIQYWQPLAQDFILREWKGYGLYFGGLFTLILIGQSWAGRVCEKSVSVEIAISKALWLNLFALIMLFISINWLNYLIGFALVAIFSGCRLLTTSFHSIFHEAAPKEIRATLDSAVSMIVRMTLIIVMPLFGFVTSMFSWNTLLILYLLTLIIVTFMSRRSDSSDMKVGELS